MPMLNAGNKYGDSGKVVYARREDPLEVKDSYTNAEGGAVQYEKAKFDPFAGSQYDSRTKKGPTVDANTSPIGKAEPIGAAHADREANPAYNKPPEAVYDKDGVAKWVGEDGITNFNFKDRQRPVAARAKPSEYAAAISAGKFEDREGYRGHVWKQIGGNWRDMTVSGEVAKYNTREQLSSFAAATMNGEISYRDLSAGRGTPEQNALWNRALQARNAKIEAQTVERVNQLKAQEELFMSDFDAKKKVADAAAANAAEKEAAKTKEQDKVRVAAQKEFEEEFGDDKYQGGVFGETDKKTGKFTAKALGPGDRAKKKRILEQSGRGTLVSTTREVLDKNFFSADEVLVEEIDTVIPFTLTPENSVEMEKYAKEVFGSDKPREEKEAIRDAFESAMAGWTTAQKKVALETAAGQMTLETGKPHTFVPKTAPQAGAMASPHQIDAQKKETVDSYIEGMKADHAIKSESPPPETAKEALASADKTGGGGSPGEQAPVYTPGADQASPARISASQYIEDNPEAAATIKKDMLGFPKKGLYGVNDVAGEMTKLHEYSTNIWRSGGKEGTVAEIMAETADVLGLVDKNGNSVAEQLAKVVDEERGLIKSKAAASEGKNVKEKAAVKEMRIGRQAPKVDSSNVATWDQLKKMVDEKKSDTSFGEAWWRDRKKDLAVAERKIAKGEDLNVWKKFIVNKILADTIGTHDKKTIDALVASYIKEIQGRKKPSDNSQKV